MEHSVFTEIRAVCQKSDFGLMLNFPTVRGCPGGALDGQYGLGFTRAYQVRVLVLTVCMKFLPLLGLATSLAQKSSSMFMCRSSSTYGKDQVQRLRENSRPLSLRFPSSEDGEIVCS